LRADAHRSRPRCHTDSVRAGDLGAGDAARARSGACESPGPA